MSAEKSVTRADANGGPGGHHLYVCRLQLVIG